MCRILYHSWSGEAVDEKQRIREYFSIVLDNPTTILQQEEAKRFFANLTPKRLYEFFIAGTPLKSAYEGYHTGKRVRPGIWGWFSMGLI